MWIVVQDPLALGRHRTIRGVTGYGETLGDAGDREVADHQAFQRPPQAPAGELRTRLSRLTGVMAPHVTAAGAPVAPDRDQQDRGAPPQRLVRQLTDHAVASRAHAPAAAAPLVRLHDPAGQHRAAGLAALPHDLEAELAQAGERGQTRGSDGSVGHLRSS